MDIKQEQALIQKAKQEDIGAFGEIYGVHYFKVFNYVLKRTANIHISQDVTSEVFFKALNNIKHYKNKGNPFSAWLYRIANHEVANYYRNSEKRKYYVNTSSQFEDTTTPSIDNEFIEAEAELERNRDFLMLHECIATLSVKYQEVIVLRFFENKPIKEISKILGKREGTVKSLLHRGCKKLKIMMS